MYNPAYDEKVGEYTITSINYAEMVKDKRLLLKGADQD